MRSGLGAAALCALAAVATRAAEPPIPAPRGFVTDLAGVISASAESRISGLLEELQQKTGAEIVVVTVPTTQPLDDFTYALRIAEAWKPGRKREDTGVVFLVAVEDRKVRILVGYGLEGILPDGLVGEIIDRAIVPAFRGGHMDGGIWRGVAELATRIAAARGVELSGAPPRTRGEPASAPPAWVLVAAVLILIALVLYQASRPARFRRRGFFPFGFGGGGFGGGGGGFGGFGGGSFGGGGAGRSW